MPSRQITESNLIELLNDDDEGMYSKLAEILNSGGDVRAWLLAQVERMDRELAEAAKAQYITEHGLVAWREACLPHGVGIEKDYRQY